MVLHKVKGSSLPWLLTNHSKMLLMLSTQPVHGFIKILIPKPISQSESWRGIFWRSDVLFETNGQLFIFWRCSILIYIIWNDTNLLMISMYPLSTLRKSGVCSEESSIPSDCGSVPSEDSSTCISSEDSNYIFWR